MSINLVQGREKFINAVIKRVHDNLWDILSKEKLPQNFQASLLHAHAKEVKSRIRTAERKKQPDITLAITLKKMWYVVTQDLYKAKNFLLSDPIFNNKHSDEYKASLLMFKFPANFKTEMADYQRFLQRIKLALENYLYVYPNVPGRIEIFKLVASAEVAKNALAMLNQKPQLQGKIESRIVNQHGQEVQLAKKEKVDGEKLAIPDPPRIHKVYD